MLKGDYIVPDVYTLNTFIIPIQVIPCKHFFMYVTSYVCDQIAQTLEVHLPAKFSWVWISQINLDFYMDSVVKLDTRKRSWVSEGDRHCPHYPSKAE